MKRVMAMMLMMLVLTGCGKTAPQTAPKQEISPPKAEEPVVKEEKTEVIPEEKTASEAAPEPELAEKAEKTEEPTEPEMKTEEKPVSEQVPIPDTEEVSVDWAGYTAQVFTDITNHPEFHVVVWEQDDSRTDLVIRQGENDWNVANRVDHFSGYEWTQITYEDVLAATQAEGWGVTLVFWDVEGGMSIECQKNTGIVIVQDPTKITYLRAVKPADEQDADAESLYDLLLMIPQDALVAQAWNVAVDGNLSPDHAAKRMAKAVAENYKNLPDWIGWKPTDVGEHYTEVIDVYLGEPGEFCCNMTLKFRFDRPEQMNSIYWQAGAGLSEPDANGDCGYFTQVHTRKNEAGEWAFLSRGTGGVMVNPKWPAEKPWPEWLVELFCLTEGQSHEWVVPGQILGLSEEEMAALPAILDQLTEAESKDLCRTLGKLLSEQGNWYYTVETLKPLLGDYGDWLDA